MVEFELSHLWVIHFFQRYFSAQQGAHLNFVEMGHRALNISINLIFVSCPGIGEYNGDKC